MATDFLVHEIWFDKFKYHDAGRKFYEQMNGPVTGSSCQSSGPGASSGPSGDHRELIIRTSSLAVATAAEDDEEDNIDLFGRDGEDDKEAVKLREERLQQYTEKKAKKLALVAKSSMLLDVEPWDEETDMAQLEACVCSVQLDELTLGCSKLVPVGYGIRRLQIQCVPEDKVGTDLLEEEITKFAEHVQSIDIAAFCKI
ncbi:Elongation factor 1-delta [Myotis brandtii]|uniref:Elongation factor 1-delta n=1 Tax=Myotis brandtii TaxID=109478 RepID=S7MVX1_MYOBR|nr:Elongation factor 1-delta [Myotis brandtii]